MKAKVFNRSRATPQQLAAHLSISDSQVLNLTKKGVIPTVVNEGRIYRYDIDDVDRILAERAKAKAPVPLA